MGGVEVVPINTKVFFRPLVSRVQEKGGVRGARVIRGERKVGGRDGVWGRGDDEWATKQ